MALFIAWLVVPLVLGALSLGCGLLVERAAGLTLPGALLLPLGLALVIVEADLVTMTSATAQLATPLAVALAVAGYGLARRRGRRVDGWALGCGVGVFAVYAAPIVLSGRATFAGYITLDDTSTWLALTDRAMEHGRSVAGLAPSTYQQVLTDYFTRLSAWCVHASGRCREADGPGHRVAVPADDRAPCRHARALHLHAVGAPGVVEAAAGGRRLPRRPAGAAVRLLAVERHQGARRRCPDRARLRCRRGDDRTLAELAGDRPGRSGGRGAVRRPQPRGRRLARGTHPRSRRRPDQPPRAVVIRTSRGGSRGLDRGSVDTVDLDCSLVHQRRERRRNHIEHGSRQPGTPAGRPPGLRDLAGDRLPQPSAQLVADERPDRRSAPGGRAESPVRLAPTSVGDASLPRHSRWRHPAALRPRPCRPELAVAECEGDGGGVTGAGRRRGRRRSCALRDGATHRSGGHRRSRSPSASCGRTGLRTRMSGWRRGDSWPSCRQSAIASRDRARR